MEGNISQIRLRTTFLGNSFGSYKLLTAETELPNSGSSYQHLSVSQVYIFLHTPAPHFNPNQLQETRNTLNI